MNPNASDRMYQYPAKMTLTMAQITWLDTYMNNQGGDKIVVEATNLDNTVAVHYMGTVTLLDGKGNTFAIN